jgi:small subunit ribosomal protein S1
VLEIGQTVKVKVLDIDRERQRISLGLKQTQSDPWQQVLDQYSEGDVVEGKVTKVVTFGAFVEIMPGVEGLVHISELAQHHVENPREVVAQGDQVQAKIIEVDPERRRLSLSLKRVEGEGPTPASELGLSDEVFGSDQQTGAVPSPEPVAAPEEPPLEVEEPPEPEPAPEAPETPEESDEQQQ